MLAVAGMRVLLLWNDSTAFWPIPILREAVSGLWHYMIYPILHE